jgi:hypothetical protein
MPQRRDRRAGRTTTRARQQNLPAIFIGCLLRLVDQLRDAVELFIG